MPLESAPYINSLNASNPTGADTKAEGDDHIRLIKSAVKATFPNLTGAVTADQSELNILDGATLSTAELNLLDGVTASTAELNILDGVTATTTEINYIDGVTSPIQTQLAGKADITGETYTGTHDFSGATAIKAPTKAPGSSGTDVATVDYANALAFSSSMPAIAGNSLKFARVNAGETSIEYAEVYAYGGRSARTSNTILAYSDMGKLIDITSGTFTQTFTAAATLGTHWFCHIRNSGTGDITLDPNGSELIDGLTSYVMYPGETRLVTCDGTGFYSIVLTSFYRTFTSTDTFVKPPGYNRLQGLAWGAGGGGNASYGGNGGCCVPFDLPSSEFSASQTFTIGAGGAAGADGGATTWLTYTTGSAGKGNTPGTGAYGRNASTGPFEPNRLAIATSTPIYADYGGGRGVNTAGSLTNVTHSIFGGAGGVASGTAGSSVFGGAGGVGAGNGTAPGGGGGDTGAGARGEIRIWGVI